MSLQVYMDERAKEWLSHKGGQLTVQKLKAKGC